MRRKSVYASETTVSAEKSRAEIEMILRRYGADRFMSGYDGRQAMVAFEAEGRRVKFVLPLPQVEEFALSEKGRRRNREQMEAAYEQEIRRRWRALALAIKAKLEVVATGISSFEDEFMAHIMLPDGSTVGAWMRPQLENVYLTGKMPPLLGPG